MGTSLNMKAQNATIQTPNCELPVSSLLASKRGTPRKQAVLLPAVLIGFLGITPPLVPGIFFPKN